MNLLIELPDDDEHVNWVLSKLHEHGLRLCNDVTCVRVTSWRPAPGLTFHGPDCPGHTTGAPAPECMR